MCANSESVEAKDTDDEQEEPADEIYALVRKQKANPDLCDKNAYRCAAFLTDGFYLPCVLFREAEAHSELALRRFQEESERIPNRIHRDGAIDCPSIVKHFVTKGNRVDFYDIARVEPSPYATPLHLLSQVRGETSMSWTQFAALMNDGTEFSFGTAYRMEFFDIPDGFAWDRVVNIVPHRTETEPVYLARPYFERFIDYADFGDFKR